MTDRYESVFASTFALLLGHSLGVESMRTGRVSPRESESAFHQTPTDALLSDAILECRARLVLVEFRRSDDHVSSEVATRGKTPFLFYIAEDAARHLLSISMRAHFFGVRVAKGDSLFSLFPYQFGAPGHEWQRYAAMQGALRFITALLSTEKANGAIGVNLPELLTYTTALAASVREATNASSAFASAPVSINTAGFLVGVGSDGRLLLREYERIDDIIGPLCSAAVGRA